jgi:hypothetical protein
MLEFQGEFGVAPGFEQALLGGEPKHLEDLAFVHFRQPVAGLANVFRSAFHPVERLPQQLSWAKRNLRVHVS